MGKTSMKDKFFLYTLAIVILHISMSVMTSNNLTVSLMLKKPLTQFKIIVSSQLTTTTLKDNITVNLTIKNIIRPEAAP